MFQMAYSCTTLHKRYQGSSENVTVPVTLSCVDADTHLKWLEAMFLDLF